MSTAAKTKRKSEAEFDADFERDIAKARAAKPDDIKVHISLRLDSDLYMELRKRAAAGECDGKYQVLINQILRSFLMSSDEKAAIETWGEVANALGKLNTIMLSNTPLGQRIGAITKRMIVWDGKSVGILKGTAIKGNTLFQQPIQKHTTKKVAKR